LATGPVGVTELVELLLDVRELLLELRADEVAEVEVADAEVEEVREVDGTVEELEEPVEVEPVEDTTEELEDPEEVDDEVTAELEETADLFCTVANDVPTKVALLLRSIAL